jgi:tRNA threonylcarbamoyladenosine biosynthesis protein TsaE
MTKSSKTRKTATITYVSRSEHDTQKIAQRLVPFLHKGAIVCLFGDLGAGKTVFVKGMAAGMKMDPDEVSSPSYVLMNIYQGKRHTLFHFDLYRLQDIEEIEGIGYEEFIYGQDIAVIEWAERLQDNSPSAFLSVRIQHQTQTRRKITLKAVGAPYLKIIERLRHENIIC